MWRCTGVVVVLAQTLVVEHMTPNCEGIVARSSRGHVLRECVSPNLVCEIRFPA